jgi:hypothetical protein
LKINSLAQDSLLVHRRPAEASAIVASKPEDVPLLAVLLMPEHFRLLKSAFRIYAEKNKFVRKVKDQWCVWFE